MKQDEPVTTAGVETFLAAGNPSLNLLRVEPGVPVDAAYEHVSILMGYIKHLVREGIWRTTINSWVLPITCAKWPRR